MSRLSWREKRSVGRPRGRRWYGGAKTALVIASSEGGIAPLQLSGGWTRRGTSLSANRASLERFGGLPD
jgi:hypothetical protein